MDVECIDLIDSDEDDKKNVLHGQLFGEDQMIRCNLCLDPGLLPVEEDRALHRSRVHSNKLFYCDACEPHEKGGKGFENFEDVFKHVCNENNIDKKNTKNIYSLIRIPKHPDGLKVFTCLFCSGEGMKFVGMKEDNFLEHIRTQHGKAARRIPGNLKRECRICSESFETDAELSDHVQIYINNVTKGSSRKPRFTGFNQRMIDDYNDTSEDDMTIVEEPRGKRKNQQISSSCSDEEVVLKKKKKSKKMKSPKKAKKKKEKAGRDESIEPVMPVVHHVTKSITDDLPMPPRIPSFRDSIVRCIFCSEKVVDLSEHLFLHHSYQCFQCAVCKNKPLIDFDSMLRHSKDVHGSRTPLEQGQIIVPRHLALISCGFCEPPEIFIGKDLMELNMLLFQHLEQHEAIHKGEQNRIDRKVLYNCRLCPDKDFLSNQLDSHILKHSQNGKSVGKSRSPSPGPSVSQQRRSYSPQKRSISNARGPSKRQQSPASLSGRPSSPGYSYQGSSKRLSDYHASQKRPSSPLSGHYRPTTRSPSPVSTSHYRSSRKPHSPVSDLHGAKRPISPESRHHSSSRKPVSPGSSHNKYTSRLPSAESSHPSTIKRPLAPESNYHSKSRRLSSPRSSHHETSRRPLSPESKHHVIKRSPHSPGSRHYQSSRRPPSPGTNHRGTRTKSQSPRTSHHSSSRRLPSPKGIHGTSKRTPSPRASHHGSTRKLSSPETSYHGSSKRPPSPGSSKRPTNPRASHHSSSRKPPSPLSGRRRPSPGSSRDASSRRPSSPGLSHPGSSRRPPSPRSSSHTTSRRPLSPGTSHYSTRGQSEDVRKMRSPSPRASHHSSSRRPTSPSSSNHGRSRRSQSPKLSHKGSSRRPSSSDTAENLKDRHSSQRGQHPSYYDQGGKKHRSPSPRSHVSHSRRPKSRSRSPLITRTIVQDKVSTRERPTSGGDWDYHGKSSQRSEDSRSYNKSHTSRKSDYESSERPSYNKSEFKIPTDLRPSRNNAQQIPVEKESQNFECRYCEEDFEDILSATGHVKKKHIEKLSQNYEHKDLLSCLVLPKALQQIKCKFCSMNKTFDVVKSVMADLRAHRESHKEPNCSILTCFTLTCRVCGLMYDDLSHNNDMNSHVATHRSEGLASSRICNYCFETFNIEEMGNHMIKNHKDQMFLCHLCKNPYHDLATIIKHLDSDHNRIDEEDRIMRPDQKNIINCRVCMLAFYTDLSDFFIQHFDKIHKGKSKLGNVDFACRMCSESKVYTSSQALKDHILDSHMDSTTQTRTSAKARLGEKRKSLDVINRHLNQPKRSILDRLGTAGTSSRSLDDNQNCNKETTSPKKNKGNARTNPRVRSDERMTGANTVPMGPGRKEPEKKDIYSKWNCPSCKFNNFERNTECRGCRKPKPNSEQTQDKKMRMNDSAIITDLFRAQIDLMMKETRDQQVALEKEAKEKQAAMQRETEEKEEVIESVVSNIVDHAFEITQVRHVLPYYSSQENDDKSDREEGELYSAISQSLQGSQMFDEQHNNDDAAAKGIVTGMEKDKADNTNQRTETNEEKTMNAESDIAVNDANVNDTMERNENTGADGHGTEDGEIEEPSSPEYNAESDSDDQLNNSEDEMEKPNNQDLETREENSGNIEDKEETVDHKKDENENIDSGEGLNEVADQLKAHTEIAVESNNDDFSNSNPNDDDENKTTTANQHQDLSSTAVYPHQEVPQTDISTAVTNQEKL